MFAENSPLRCYHCKQELFSRLKEIAAARSIPHVLDGSNFDDRVITVPAPSRPGTRRALSSPRRRFDQGGDPAPVPGNGLPTWDKPSWPAWPRVFPINGDRSPGAVRVGRAEDIVRELGIKQVRVRHHGEIARIEVDSEEFGRLMTPRPAPRSLTPEATRLCLCHS